MKAISKTSQGANMKKLFLWGAVTALLYGCGGSDAVTTENVVVTNRGGASLTVIDAKTDAVKQTVTIAGSEPMYVVYVKKTHRLYVGDRAQNKVHVLNPVTFQVESSVDVGRGVFHMWADGQGDQLWVANDLDNTVSVIKLSDRSVRTLALDAKPHDVFLTADGQTAFISLLINGAADKVVRFNAKTLVKESEADVGEDPHLYFVEQDQKLYVPNQEGGLFVLGRDLTLDYRLSLEGSHGIFPSRDGQYVLMTNLPGKQLYSLNTRNRSLAEIPLDVSVHNPHNLVLNGDSKKAFVTHSGPAAIQVTVYDMDGQGKIKFSKTVMAGTNPFGIAYYSY
jgi:YVTN family beta-propeller protein